MIVYSDRTRRETARDLLRRLLRGFAAPAPAASALLIEAGMLESAVVDALSPEMDGPLPLVSRLNEAMQELALAARGDEARLDTARQRFEALVDDLPSGPVQVSEPEGFAFYALYPDAYAEAARRFLETERAGSAVVVGIRSIGTALSAVVAAEFLAMGVAVTRLTVRPRGHPWDRELRLSPELQAVLAGAEHVLVVDEGPGISGTSFASAAEAALASGVPEGRVHLFTSWNCDGSGLRSERAQAIWPRLKRWTVSFEEQFLDTGRLAAAWGGSSLRDLSGGLWRDVVCADRTRWPAVQPQHERRKYLLEQDDGTRLLLKFAGLGERGRRAQARAERQAAEGFGPEVLGLREGFLGLRWIEGQPASNLGWALSGSERGLGPRWTGVMAAYLSSRAEEATGPARFDDLLAMVRLNVAEGLGEAATEGLGWMERMRNVVEARPAVRVDGRMLPLEWLCTQAGPRKCDGVDHHDDHFWPGSQDIAWDLAGAMVEWGMNADARERLLGAFEAKTGDGKVRMVLPFYGAAYLAWRLGYTSLAAETLGESEDGRRMARDRDSYTRLLRAALERAAG